MSSKLISAEIAGLGQPVPWRVMGGPAEPEGRKQPFGEPNGAKADTSDAAVQLAQLQIKMAASEAEKGRLIQEAREAGRLTAEAEVRPVLQKLAASLQQASELPARLRAQAESDVVKLAVAIAQRILQRELNVDPAVIAGLVRVGLEKVRIQDVMRVRVCPDQVAAIKECLARSGGSHIEVSGDPAQERGGMIFETNRGKLDVSIGTQLNEIERGLTDRLRGQG